MCGGSWTGRLESIETGLETFVDQRTETNGGERMGKALWVGVGGAIGVAIGILFAPRKGSETRRAIAERTEPVQTASQEGRFEGGGRDRASHRQGGRMAPRDRWKERGREDGGARGEGQLAAGAPYRRHRTDQQSARLGASPPRPPGRCLRWPWLRALTWVRVRAAFVRAVWSSAVEAAERGPGGEVAAHAVHPASGRRRRGADVDVGRRYGVGVEHPGGTRE